jgi:predicted Zn-ribbon and HTH transcriptional regulator
MEKIELKIEGIKCARCGYIAINRTVKPVRCPRCQHTHGSSVRKPFTRVDNYGAATGQ